MTAFAAKNTLEVGKKRVIKNVQTFKDMMQTAGGDDARKNIIIGLYRKSYDKILDKDYKYF